MAQYFCLCVWLIFLLIFSNINFKMAARWPYWIFLFPDFNFSLALNIISTMVVQGRQTCRSNWYTMFAFLTGRPMADHCASILRLRWCVCLHPASFERPVSDRPPRRPLCDCFEHAQNFMASMAMPERPVYHPWTTKATVLPPFCLQRRPGQFCGCTREAQRSQPLCKGVLPNRSGLCLMGAH